MTDLEIKQALAPMVAHVGKSMTNEQIRYWHQMLDDLPADVAKRAIIATLRDYQFAGFPPVGVVRRNAGAAAGGMSSGLRAQTAWSVARRSISSFGGYTSVQFDDPLTTATIRLLGGWMTFCETPSGKDLDTWLQNRFIETYESMMQCGIEAHQAAPLMGIVEAQRNSTGWGLDATGGLLATPLEKIPVGLPEFDKKLIRGVIQDARSPVALPAPAKEIGRMEPLPVPESAKAKDVDPAHERLQKWIAGQELKNQAENLNLPTELSNPGDKPFRKEARSDS